jgi:drug/metabolite transporter (DMT)-like permease
MKSEPATMFRHHDSPLIGIACFVFAMLCFSAMNTIIRDLTMQLSSLQAVFLRNLFSILFLLPIALKHGVAEWKTTKPGLHFWRAFIGLIAMETWFFSLSLIPLNQATALSFTAPLFATIFAILFLKETIGPWRLGALIIGFAGALIIIRPGSEGALSASAFFAVFAAAGMAAAGIFIKLLTRTEPSWRIVFYMAILMSLMSAPLAVPVWRDPTQTELIQCAAIAFLSTLAQLAMVSGFARAPVVLLTPFDFTRLVFTAIFAYIFFSETLDVYTVTGAAIIVTSSVVITWREKARERKFPSSETV